MTGRKVVLHTDVVRSHLEHRGAGPSALRSIMGEAFCYTTVFNAIELFALARGARETRAVREALSAMKILGLNAKHAPKFGALLAAQGPGATMDVLVAGLCIESGLPLVTARPARFRSVRGLEVLTPRTLLGRV